jgi:glutamate 5-kinase
MMTESSADLQHQELIRRQVVDSAKTLVVKVGTNALSKPDDTLDIDKIANLTEQLNHVRQSGRRVVLVSSGAIGSGLGLLGLKKRPKDLRLLQAAAAMGQAHLIRHYDDCIKKYGYHAAQLLLTANDFKSRHRYLNVRNTLRTLFEFGALPIVNENDTVSIDEIRFGDNDRLAALVANQLDDPPLLVILSVIDGLYDGDPKLPGSKVVPLIENFEEDLFRFASDDKSSRGTGGMQSKLESARLATGAGRSVIIANGRNPRVLEEILAYQPVGTLFVAQPGSMSARERWIGYSLTPAARVFVDEGAFKAIVHQGSSLLAIGIKSIEGDFKKGQPVSLLDPAGREFARGLTNYGVTDALRICGKRTVDFPQDLGESSYPEVIHRDNLVVTRRTGKNEPRRT